MPKAASVRAVVGGGLRDQRVHAAHPLDSEHREQDGSGHRDDELEGVGHDDAPQPGEHAVPGGDGEERDRRHPRVHVQRDTEDGDHGARHPAHDDQVDGKGEVERAKTPEYRRRPTAVAQLGELHIGEDAGPAPEPGKEEHGQDPGERTVPPEPVAGHAVLRDQARHGERRVGGERRRHHGRPGEPPRERAAGHEIVGQRLTGPPRVGQADGRRGHEVQRDDHPVRQLESHGGSRGGGMLTAGETPGARRPSPERRAGEWKSAACR